MPTHDVAIEIPAKLVSNTDVRVVVHADGSRLGELLFSKGTIDWRPRNGQRMIKMPWERFAQLMEQYGSEIPRSRVRRS